MDRHSVVVVVAVIVAVVIDYIAVAVVDWAVLVDDMDPAKGTLVTERAET